jgi:hypothetical protein
MNHTAEEILRKIRKLPSESFATKFRFSFPYTYIEIFSKSFADKDFQEQEEILADVLGIRVSDLRSFQSYSMIVFDYLSQPSENLSGEEIIIGHHWLARALGITAGNLIDYPIPSIHFYGFKGGQARSTVLGMLANALADDGWRVLLVDADIEAPSLNSMYEKKNSEISKSLLGAYLGEEISSILAYTSKNNKYPGSVEIIPSKPDLDTLDIEYASFLIKAGNDPHIIRKLSDKVKDYIKSKEFDIVIFDHRSGLSTFPLFWYENFPGSVSFYARLDNQWKSGINYLRMFSQLANGKHKVVVSFKPDEEDANSYMERNQEQIETFLEILSDSTEEDDIDPINQSQWIEWGYDSSFRSKNLPRLDLLNSSIQKSIANLRSELDLTQKKHSNNGKIKTSISGATDQGDFIITPLAKEILNPESNISYIFGRKGTGKTRLYRELFESNSGKPLLSSSDFDKEKGLGSGNTEIKQATEKFSGNKQMFWWSLILAGLKSNDYSTQSIENEWKKIRKNTSEEIFNELNLETLSLKIPITFLIDGIETSFQGEEISAYTDNLFQVLSSIQYDSKYNKKLRFKLFLREDLRDSGTQNIEQQIEGRAISLYWDTLSILNFLLLKISENPWFGESFPETINKIQDVTGGIKSGNLIQETEAENLLKEIFPPGVKKYKISIMSFFKNYFSDASGTRDNENRLNYYPRVFMDFIDLISNPSNLKSRYNGNRLLVGKVDEELVFLSHIQATENYFKQVQEELNNMVSFDKEFNANRKKLELFLNALSGESTPFEIVKLIDTIYQKTKQDKINKKDIESTLNSMKSLGIFEVWPKNPGHWRVGKLFKQALNMKFRR